MSGSNTKPQITLHWLEVSRATRVLWLLEEAQIPYELKTYKRQKNKLADPKLKEVHPLGKSPVVEIKAHADAESLALAESGAIVEYLCDHFAPWLIPPRYQDGKEDQVGGETDSWLRHRFFMHYAEGSIMPLNLIGLVAHNIKTAPVPFFIRPITNGIAGKLQTSFLDDQYQTHYQFLEEQLSTSPHGGPFLCGNELTGADILMSFPLEVANSRSGVKADDFPKAFAYVDRLTERAAYQRAVQKIHDIEGEFKTKL